MRVDSTPLPRPFARGSIAVPTGGEAAAFDHSAISAIGVPEAALMESAGRAAADLAEHLAPRGPIVALAGGGNNGGDALVAARTLRARGREVGVVIIGDRPAPDPLLHGWSLPTTRVAEPDAAELSLRLSNASLVIDGLLGTGLRSAPRAAAAAAIRAVNAAGCLVLSLDVPSGVVADSGAVPGDGVQATCTLAFGWPKLGSLLEPGRSATGRLIVAEIGFPPLPPEAFGARLLTPGWLERHRPRRATETHKNQVGAVLVVGGSEGMAGAVVLSARAALRSGAGFVRVASSEANREVIQATLPDAPFVALDDVRALEVAVEASRGVVVGPGLQPDAAAEVLPALLSSRRPLVLDAGALSALSEAGLSTLDKSGRSMLDQSGRPTLDEAGEPRVWTPHPGEAAALLECGVSEIQADRPRAARLLASRSRATVVLKGAPTLIAHAGQPLAISAMASSDLAVAGMGDVLAGSIGSFLAQGLGATDAAGAALLAGARAAQLTGLGAGLTASDVPDLLPRALVEAGPGHTDLPFPWVTYDADAPS